MGERLSDLSRTVTCIILLVPLIWLWLCGSSYRYVALWLLSSVSSSVSHRLYVSLHLCLDNKDKVGWIRRGKTIGEA